MTTIAEADTSLELTDEEIAAHDADEAIIEHGLKTFVEVGEALARIRDRKSYRATHDNFAGYLRDRWNLSRSRGYELIEAAFVAGQLSGIPDSPPINAGQAVELAKIPADQQVEVWQKVIEDTGGKPTARAIKTVSDRLGVIEVPAVPYERDTDGNIVHVPTGEVVGGPTETFSSCGIDDSFDAGYQIAARWLRGIARHPNRWQADRIRTLLTQTTRTLDRAAPKERTGEQDLALPDFTEVDFACLTWDIQLELTALVRAMSFTDCEEVARVAHLVGLADVVRDFVSQIANIRVDALGDPMYYVTEGLCEEFPGIERRKVQDVVDSIPVRHTAVDSPRRTLEDVRRLAREQLARLIDRTAS